MKTDSTIPYATPADRPAGPRVWAAAAIAPVGLGLILVGGYFLIGVMFITSGTFGVVPAGGLTANQRALVVVLYALSVPAFAGGVWALVTGLRGLLMPRPPHFLAASRRDGRGRPSLQDAAKK